MNRTLVALILAVVYLMTGMSSFGQESSGESPAERAPAEQAHSASDTDVSPPAGARSAGDPTQPEGSSADRDSDPYDYQASEQISEDLSVSFPVDI